MAKFCLVVRHRPELKLRAEKSRRLKPTLKQPGD